MYIFNIAKAIKKMSVNEINDFIFENYCKELNFIKKAVIIQCNSGKKYLLLLANKLGEKIADPQNAKC